MSFLLLLLLLFVLPFVIFYVLDFYMHVNIRLIPVVVELEMQSASVNKAGLTITSERYK